MNRVKEFREKHGLTQEQLAVKLDRTSGHISKLERGIYKITSDVLFRLDALEKEINTRASEDKNQ
jgi:transcriptional regulator with XRE-family HTH domain